MHTLAETCGRLARGSFLVDLLAYAVPERPGVFQQCENPTKAYPEYPAGYPVESCFLSRAKPFIFRQ